MLTSIHETLCYSLALKKKNKNIVYEYISLKRILIIVQEIFDNINSQVSWQDNGNKNIMFYHHITARMEANTEYHQLIS